MPVLYHSFKSGTLTDNPLTNVATTANSAGFSALPVITNPDTCWLVLDPEGSAGTPEIVQVTAHTSSATSLTIVRGQQTATGGSTARQHNVGTKWVLALTPSDLAYLLNKVLTTKGDIAVFGSDVTRLPVGTNGQTLTADSTEATGLKWGSAAIADNSITLAKMADNSVSSAEIVNGSVTFDELATTTIRTGSFSGTADGSANVAVSFGVTMASTPRVLINTTTGGSDVASHPTSVTTTGFTVHADFQAGQVLAGLYIAICGMG